MISARGTDIWFNKRAMKPQNRAESCISCMEKGLFQKSLLQKGFLTQNRAQKGKRAIRPQPILNIVKKCDNYSVVRTLICFQLAQSSLVYIA